MLSQPVGQRLNVKVVRFDLVAKGRLLDGEPRESLVRLWRYVGYNLLSHLLEQIALRLRRWLTRLFLHWRWPHLCHGDAVIIHGALDH